MFKCLRERIAHEKSRKLKVMLYKAKTPRKNTYNIVFREHSDVPRTAQGGQLD